MGHLAPGNIVSCPWEGEFNRRGGGAHAGARQAAPQRSGAVGASGMQFTVQMAL
ncbi:hypothetical protein ACQR5S_07070 [Xanthomonas oryzae pv. oryzicola]|uniref:hypothetical protein n=1 Tax=Xanthomonas oryzae TaxID=347 RepID=UPI000A4ABB9D|nr:hypothetical protein XOCgx_3403 [Xanthomonas oryzae pv. oryzicola]